MRGSILIRYGILFFLLPACQSGKQAFDASGTFEADEVIVSSEVNGRLLNFNLREGMVIPRDTVVGHVDSIPLVLQRAQAEASLVALKDRMLDVHPEVKLLKDQMAVQRVQLANLQYEKERTERLIRSDAATTKQLDDLNTQIDVLEKQIDVNQQQISVQLNSVGTQNRTVLSESRPLRSSIAEIQDQVSRAAIRNPIGGTVLTKYALAGEMTAQGKALYKIADLSTLILRAYISGTQLSAVRLQQPVRVFVDDGPDKYREYPGVVTWVSDKAEFTPKTIQTKDERANLVYAVKINVRNDALLKIGMYGEVKF